MINTSLFVFSTNDPKQNATSLLTPVSNSVSYALSSGTIGFALHGSSVNHFLIGGNSSTANQILSCKWLLKLPWRAKPRVPLERASKTILETGVKSDVAFCSRLNCVVLRGFIWLRNWLSLKCLLMSGFRGPILRSSSALGNKI